MFSGVLTLLAVASNTLFFPAVSAQSTASAQPSAVPLPSTNMLFTTGFPVTYIINKAANTQWVADPSNKNPMNLYLMDYTGTEIRQPCCVNVSYSDNTINCLWFPLVGLNPNNNYLMMLTQPGSPNYTSEGRVTILAPGTSELYTGAAPSTIAPSSTSASSTRAATSAASTGSASGQPQVQSTSSYRLGTGAIAGIVVGCVVGGIAIAGLIACILLRRRRSRIRRAQLEMANSAKFDAPDGIAGVDGNKANETSESSAELDPTSTVAAAAGHGFPKDRKDDGSGSNSINGTLVEAPLNERPHEMMDEDSQPRFELEANEISEMYVPPVVKPVYKDTWI